MAAADWQLVGRRNRKYPENWKTGSEPLPTAAKPFTPFAPTYAQMVQRKVIRNLNPNPQKTPTPSPPSSPSSSTKAEYYISPHSPTKLRFPPSARYEEWRGRCFRCCKQGHTKALCRNNLKCSKCWHEGHVGSQCRSPSLNPAAVPFKPAPTPAPARAPNTEPLFEDLLTGPCPATAPEMPEGRPAVLRCYIPRDESIFKEIEKLTRGVVLHSNLDNELSIDTVAAYATRTGLVKTADVSISILPRRRYLIMLPVGINPQEFIKATPWDLWDFGYEFQLWSPHEEGSVTIPSFKVLVHLHGLLTYLWKEPVVINAVSSFGTYLGSLESLNPASLEYWVAVVATEDLRQIPLTVSVRVGGMDHSVAVQPVKWIHNLLYGATDLPQIPIKFTVPPPSSPDSSSDDGAPGDDNELIPMRRSVLREICKGRDIHSLPAQLREMLAGEEERHPTSATPCHSVAAENLVQQSQNSTDLMSPQLERLCETGQQQGAAGHYMPPAAAPEAAKNQGSHMPRILQRSSDPACKGKDKMDEVGQSLNQTQLATPTPQICSLPDPPRGRGRPRGSKKKSTLQLGESAKSSLHRTLEKGPFLANSDTVEPPHQHGQLTGHRSPTIQLVGSAPYNLRPQQIRQTRHSRTSDPNKERNTQSAFPFPADDSLLVPKRGAVSREVQKCLQIADGPSPLNHKRKSLGHISIPSRPDPQKKIIGAGRPPNNSTVQATLNPEGFYEVQVQQAYCKELGNACGVTEKDVMQCLQEDNSERQLVYTSPAGTSHAPPSDDKFTPGRFDPDSADELESDDE
ncbi:hypothetical protein FCM35_KLT15749 [Carex littledalei]|uniref:CCHC-type domain-containing protein n=1 Tax=Carex littledalei TaxID=544730 RepID=A0A833RHI0_9POAL|nr:hypothetical protein FCM35_KLT15749 [Carex littledalei]